jgi:hypothetical protein
MEEAAWIRPTEQSKLETSAATEEWIEFMRQ